jgi:hypothetical protein
LQTLLDNGILSAPVYDSAAKQYTGFLDIRDLVSFVVFVHDEQKVTDSNTLKDIITHGSKLFTTPTTDGVTISCKLMARIDPALTTANYLYDIYIINAE